MIVVARYNESLSWLKDVKDRYTVYDKGDGGNVVNKGREGDTWLTYITGNYNKLPLMIYFVQGDPFEHCSDLLSRMGYTSAWLPLGEMHSNDRLSFGDLPVAETYYRIFGKHKSDFNFCTGAQYAVNRRCILNKPLGWWKELQMIYDETYNNAWTFERLWVDIWESKIVR
jgi:hypothetical protein